MSSIQPFLQKQEGLLEFQPCIGSETIANAPEGTFFELVNFAGKQTDQIPEGVKMSMYPATKFEIWHSKNMPINKFISGVSRGRPFDICLPQGQICQFATNFKHLLIPTWGTFAVFNVGKILHVVALTYCWQSKTDIRIALYPLDYDDSFTDNVIRQIIVPVSKVEPIRKIRPKSPAAEVAQ